MKSMKTALFFAATLGLIANVSAFAFAADGGVSDAINNAGQTVYQYQDGSDITDGWYHNANYDENAFQNVSGNVGTNNAAGSLNQQTNTLYLDTTTERTNWQSDYSNEQNNLYVHAGDGSYSSDSQEATIEDQVFEFATGNVGLNNAAGNANQQQNGAAILESSTTRVEGGENQDISIEMSNSQSGNSVDQSGANEANIEGNAFDHFKGNAGVNNAAGNGNQQGNSLLVSGNPNESEYTVELENSISNGQSTNNGAYYDTSGNSCFDVFGCDGNSAKFTDSAFSHANGNIGANNASGNMNQQQNQLAVLTTGELDDTVTVEVNNSITGSNDYNSPLNEADFTSQAFQNASGNIGANNAAGNMNQQVNQATIVH